MGSSSGDPLRIGTLGAARITPRALVRPARELVGVEVAAVASRDRDRANRFAADHSIARVHDTYADLVTDPALDAVYIPLPNGLHGRWATRALDEGKHVLCEKPLAANAEEAQAVVDTARGAERVLVEAFHWRYHPLADRLREIVRDELGELLHVEAELTVPLVNGRDIRWNLDLAGGSLMDLGCYAVHVVRTVAGEEPAVAEATARTRRPGVDRVLRAELAFPSGATGRVRCGMLSGRVLRVHARAIGTRGRLSVLNPVAPQYAHLIRWRSRTRRRVETCGRTPSYRHQLAAFRDSVRSGAPVPTGGDDAVANMAVIDAIYLAAGLEPRRPTLAKG